MVAPASLLLKLPSGAGELTARLPGTRVMEPCSGWAMSPFQNPQAFSTPNWPPAFDGLSVSLRLPTEVRAGAILDYQVKLTNDGEQSVPLIDWCPNYVDTLTSSTGQVIAKEGHRLNCATDIPPGGIVRFDIHVAVPPSVVAGRYEVNWELGFPSNRAVAGRAALAVYQ